MSHNSHYEFIINHIMRAHGRMILIFRKNNVCIKWNYVVCIPARKLFFLSTVFFYSTVIGTLFFIRKCLFVELRHRMIKSRLFLVRNCLLVEFDSIVGSKLIYQSVWRALRMKRQTVSSDMKSKRMIKNEGPLKSALICRIFVS